MYDVIFCIQKIFIGNVQRTEVNSLNKGVETFFFVATRNSHLKVCILYIISKTVSTGLQSQLW